MHRVLLPFLVLSVLALAIPAVAQEEVASEDSAQANNPLAEFKALNFQNYYIPELSGADDENANTFWLRYVQPFGKWLVRASLPTLRVPKFTILSRGPGQPEMQVFFGMNLQFR